MAARERRHRETETVADLLTNIGALLDEWVESNDRACLDVVLDALLDSGKSMQEAWATCKNSPRSFGYMDLKNHVRAWGPSSLEGCVSRRRERGALSKAPDDVKEWTTTIVRHRPVTWRRHDWICSCTDFGEAVYVSACWLRSGVDPTTIRASCPGGTSERWKYPLDVDPYRDEFKFECVVRGIPLEPNAPWAKWADERTKE